jgi:hypothetical protein
MHRKSLLHMGTAIFVVLLIAVLPVLADESVLVNGTFYWRNITPQNDIYEKVVYPGDTIVLGRTYDLTYVSGVNKRFAWWSDDNNEGMTCTPDIINNISYIDTGGKISPKNVTLDPDHWRTGNWWQWDGCYQLRYSRSEPEARYSVYTADNNLMFHIIRDPIPPTPVIIYVSAIPTPTPVKTTAIPTTTVPAPVKDESWPWWYYPIFAVIAFIGIRIAW